jgi:uncharacterized protein (DUF58 family)
MISNKVAYYIALMFLLVSAGMALLIWELVIAALPLAVYIILTLQREDRVGIVCRWSVSTTRAIEGQRIGVTLRLQNPEDRQCFCVVDCTLPEELDVVKGSSRVALRIPPEGREVVGFEVLSNRFGIYKIGPVCVMQRSIAGTIASMDMLVEGVEVAVFPKRERIRRGEVRTRRTRVWMGNTRSKNRGVEGEFHSIRRYQPGDGLRSINWRASARTGEVLVNEYVSERGGDVVVILDARGSVVDETFAKGVRIADQLSSVLLRQGHRVGLVVLREFIDRIYPSHGKMQEMRITETLLRVRPGGETYVRDVTWLLTRFFPRGALAIVITPLRDEEIIGTLAMLRRAGVEMLVLSPDYLSEGPKERTRADEISVLAKRLVAVERAATIRSVSSFATVISIEEAEPLSLVLRSVERIFRQRRGVRI